MNRLPLEVQTLYAELMKRLSARDARRSIGHVPGGFVTKEIKGERCAYFQYSDPGSVKRQVYVGRKDSVLDAVIARWRGAREQLAEESAGIQRWCSLLRLGGASSRSSWMSDRAISAWPGTTSSDVGRAGHKG